MRQARFLRLAEAEANEAVAYLDEQRTGLGDRFEQDLFDTITFMTQHPFSGKPIGGIVRQAGLRKFRHNVIYVIDGDEIVIVAVAHQRRRPGYWRHRLAML